MDYYVICVTLVSWMRFFSFFLVIRIISKLLHTLIRMLKDTIGFMFIICCYLIVMATVFTTLFSIVESELYGNFTSSIRTLFDAFLGSYVYVTDPSFKMSFSILMMSHVFISNVFLLNYLVALLSTVYEMMMDLGEFQYKSDRYQYIEKYSIPMIDMFNYKELVIHPPPLNFFGLFLIPFAFSKTAMKKTGMYYAKIMYWFENIPFLVVFLIYEIALAPIIFIKILSNILIQSSFKMIT